MNIVEQTGLEALLRDTRRGDGDLLLPGGGLGLTNGGSTPSVTTVNRDPSPSGYVTHAWGCSWVTIQHGTMAT